MRTEHLISFAFIAALAGASCSIAKSQDTSSGQDLPATSELIVQGRVIDETAEALPQKPGYILLASHWTYHIRVTHVILGDEKIREIIASRDSDPALRTDRDFIFHMIRKPDGTYDLKKVDRIG
jgi:hypothetical protein